MKSKNNKRVYFLIYMLPMLALSFYNCSNSNNRNKEFGKSDSTTIVEKIEKQNLFPKILDSISNISNKSIITIGDLTYSGINFKIASTFTFDRYDDSYHYRTAERGEKFITSNMSIKSKLKEPALHTFALYSLEPDSSLSLISVLEYRFQRWSDYATYLGNYHDTSNDFAYKEVVKFVLGTSISEDDLKKKIFVISKKLPDFIRKVERFDNPPVSYISSIKMPQRISRDFEWNENELLFVAKIK